LKKLAGVAFYTLPVFSRQPIINKKAAHRKPGHHYKRMGAHFKGADGIFLSAAQARAFTLCVLFAL
jgi:hypothetical protein